VEVPSGEDAGAQIPTASPAGAEYVVRVTATGARGLLVRDASTGQILSLGRGASATVATRAQTLEVTSSHGVVSRTHRVHVTPR